MAQLIIQCSLVLLLILALDHISHGGGQAAEKIELETSESNMVTQIETSEWRVAREAGRKSSRARKGKRQNKKKSKNENKKSRKIKKKSGQGKNRFGKGKKKFGNRKNNRRKLTKKSKLNRKKSPKTRRKSNEKSRLEAKLGKQACDKTVLQQKIKDYVKISNQMRQLKRLTRNCEIMEKKAIKSVEAFEATVTALDPVVANDDLTSIREKLKKCSKSAKDKCQKSSVKACKDETLYTKCNAELQGWLTKYGPSKGSCLQQEDSEASCICITKLPTISSECLQFTSKSEEAVDSKKKCTDATEEGSFGHCKKLQIEAAEKGPGAGCKNPGPVVSTVSGSKPTKTPVSMGTHRPSTKGTTIRPTKVSPPSEETTLAGEETTFVGEETTLTDNRCATGAACDGCSSDLNINGVRYCCVTNTGCDDSNTPNVQQINEEVKCSCKK